MASFNNPQYNYVEGSVIVNNVKNKLGSFIAQGLLDDSLFYKPMKSCLDRLGMKVHPQRSVTIVIQDKMGQLPKDFYKAIYATGCSNVEYWENPSDGPEGTRMNITEKAVVSIPVCKTKENYCTDECGNLFELVQEFDLHKIKLTNFFNIAIEKSEKFCTSELNLSSQYSENHITIKNNCIYANFSGYIYLEYLSNLHGEDDELLIPDYTQITDWIETSIMVECLEKLYLNGEGDVFQRLQYLQNSLLMKQSLAISFAKMNEVQDFYDLKRVLNARFAKYKTIVKSGPKTMYLANFLTNNLA